MRREARKGVSIPGAKRRAVSGRGPIQSALTARPTPSHGPVRRPLDLRDGYPLSQSTTTESELAAVRREARKGVSIPEPGAAGSRVPRPQPLLLRGLRAARAALRKPGAKRRAVSGRGPIQSALTARPTPSHGPVRRPLDLRDGYPLSQSTTTESELAAVRREARKGVSIPEPGAAGSRVPRPQPLLLRDLRAARAALRKPGAKRRAVSGRGPIQSALTARPTPSHGPVRRPLDLRDGYPLSQSTTTESELAAVRRRCTRELRFPSQERLGVGSPDPNPSCSGISVRLAPHFGSPARSAGRSLDRAPT